MKIDNSGYIIKGILLAVCGVCFAFFPNVISWTFYILGGIIVVGSLLTSLGGITKGDGSLLPAGGIGIAIGLFIMCLPKVISAHISIILGFAILIIAIVQIIKALSKEMKKGLKIIQLIFGIILLISSVFLIFEPFKGGNLIRIIVGIILICYALFNFYVAYVISERNGGVVNSSSAAKRYDDIIDTVGHDVNDSDNQPKIQ
ncbi:DUF308 domain-containing protein [Ruminococcus sp.]|uniref:DUF308 domain-containing protein n=1 Tax=Ruminococcus sp. TaxID=41978 RepID=UPI0025EE9923|nr:DUF308 domain-containing protein [Ruminococcus sp.]MCR4637807.1 DUF308 domain-containing protein [Ruminococcus sp.]